jgi:hypothetical protein
MAMTPLPDQLRSPARRRVILARGAAVSACALLAAACGSTAAPATSASGSGSASVPAGSGASGSPGAGSAGPAAAAKISLDVTFSASSGSAATHYTLRCEPAGGTAPHPAAACARLLTAPSLFGPRPGHIMCPMILQSDARATVSGTYLGKAVHVTVVEGGCDLARWAKLKAMFS